MGMIGEKGDLAKGRASMSMMSWCSRDAIVIDEDQTPPSSPPSVLLSKSTPGISKSTPPNFSIPIRTCPSCSHEIKFNNQGGEMKVLTAGLPAGVKFDPSDQELLEHLEAKVWPHQHKLHGLIDKFIPTLEWKNIEICFAHPEKLPGVRENWQIRHFFHRFSKPYTTGNRKRRKIDTDNNGGETIWHKIIETKPIFVGGKLRGFKKILVLYSNIGKQWKPEKTNWVRHQYHLASNEEEKYGTFVVSKVFYVQTQP